MAPVNSSNEVIQRRGDATRLARATKLTVRQRDVAGANIAVLVNCAVRLFAAIVNIIDDD